MSDDLLVDVDITVATKDSAQKDPFKDCPKSIPKEPSKGCSKDCSNSNVKKIKKTPCFFHFIFFQLEHHWQTEPSKPDTVSTNDHTPTEPSKSVPKVLSNDFFSPKSNQLVILFFSWSHQNRKRYLFISIGLPKISSMQTALKYVVRFLSITKINSILERYQMQVQVRSLCLIQKSVLHLPVCLGKRDLPSLFLGSHTMMVNKYIYTLL